MGKKKPVEVVVEQEGKPSRPSAAPPGPGELSLTDAFERFKSTAQLIATERVIVCKADLPLVYANARQGASAVLTLETRVRAELPSIEVNLLREIPDIAGGLLHADALAVSSPAVSRAEIDAQYQKLQTQRAPMLLVAQAFALKGLFPADRVDEIVRGNGMHNHALDGIQLSHLFASTPGVANMHPFSAQDVADASDAGHWILRNTMPDGSRRVKNADAGTALRDRFWTLLVERHELLRRAGFFLFGEAEVDDRVPLLQSRVASPRAKTPDAPTPPAPPTP